MVAASHGFGTGWHAVSFFPYMPYMPSEGTQATLGLINDCVLLQALL